MTTFTGRGMKQHLGALGDDLQRVTKSTDGYTAEFHVPRLDSEVDPAAIWGQRIQAIMPDAIIVATHDTFANWRPGSPIIFASVLFKLLNKDESE